MRTFSFLCRPVKPVLYSILLALILTAALVFGWQYHLDGLVLDHAIDTYAYVGTLVRTEGQVLDYEATRDAGIDFIWADYGFGKPEYCHGTIHCFKDLLTM